MNDAAYEEDLRDFASECHSALDEMDRALASSLSEERDVQAAFRALHTIKGAASFMNFLALEGFAHSAENILDSVRKGATEPSSALAALLRAVAGTLRRTIASIETRRTADTPALVHGFARLVLFCHTRGIALPPLRSEVADGLDMVMVSGAASMPPPSSSEPSRETNTASDDAALPEALGLFGEIAIAWGKAQPEDVSLALRAQRQGDPRHVGELLVEVGVLASSDVQAILLAQAGSQRDSRKQAVEIELNRLDDLMRTVGDLVLTRNEVSQAAQEVTHHAVTRASVRLEHLTSALQTWIAAARTQPLDVLFVRYERSVRHLAAELGKDVRLVVSGADTLLDRTIVDALRDPLMHLVRNAVDHGIESPEERLAQKKPRSGTLSIRAFHEGGLVHIELSDDGRGVDADKIRDKAVRRGLVDKSRATSMDKAALLQLIFVPGFSTAENVTNVSGRGVGMDVVKTNIERVGGSIALSSSVGSGTRITLTIPLTLSIMPALMVRCAAHEFALPQSSVLEALKLRPEADVDNIGEAEVYVHRGEILPLVDLRGLLALKREAREEIDVVVLSSDRGRFGLVVDEVRDWADIVVKPVSHHVRRLSVYAGGAIMSTGAITLILDVSGVASAAQIRREIGAQATRQSVIESDASRQETPRLFVHAGERTYGIHLSDIVRVEESVERRVEDLGATRLIQHEGRALRVAPLVDIVGLAQETALETLPMVVLERDGRRLGLVVDRIGDVVYRLDYEEHTEGPWTTGCGSQGTHVVELLNVDQLLEAFGGSIAENDAVRADGRARHAQ